MSSCHVEVLKSHMAAVHDTVSGTLKKVDPLVLVLGTVAGTLVYLKVVKVYRASERPLGKRIAGWAFAQLRCLPAIRKKVEKELSGPKKEINEMIHKDDPDRTFISIREFKFAEIPEEALTSTEVLELATRSYWDGFSYENYGKFAVNDGYVSGAVYTDRGGPHLDLLAEIYRSYAFSNPLHPDVFPGARKMEAEVIRMVMNLYHAPESGSGSLTTGGTESIIMACFAYRNKANARGVDSPVILCSESAHAAFDKAAILCGMRIRHVPVDKNNRVDLKAMERAIDGSVCMLVGSAPNYPTGTVDPISAIAKLGQKYNIPVHVDACLGGFLIPFMTKAGYPLPYFDFRNPGVTSISCDTHKYGCTPKGSSVVMYRSKELHHFQYFSVPDWMGGIYATPTICEKVLAGSRAGANSAVAWATLLSFGRQEYVMRCRKIVEAAREIAEGVKSIPGLEIHGSPDVSVVAFRSNVFNIFSVSDRMNKKGYSLNTLQNPNAVHICLTYNHAKDSAVSTFLTDLREVCQEVDSLPNKGNDSNTAALYGMAAQMPDKTLVDEIAFEYLDACYAKPPQH